MKLLTVISRVFKQGKRRRFLIFIGSGFIMLTIVFSYAQYERSHNQNTPIPTFSNNEGRVLSATIQPESTTDPNTLPVSIKIDKQPVNQYWPQKITIETKAEAEVRLQVTYTNGSINNGGTQTGFADKNGRFIVKWNVNGRNIIGTAQIKVVVTSDGEQGIAEDQFEIVRSQSSTTTNNSSPPPPSNN